MCYGCYEFKLFITTKLHMWHHINLLSYFYLSSIFQGVLKKGGSLSWGSVQVDLCPGGLSRGLLCRGGSLFRGGSLSGVGGSLFRGISVRETSPYGNEPPVRIPLECILVLIKSEHFCQNIDQFLTDFLPTFTTGLFCVN